jgi:hypothetical protein
MMRDMLNHPEILGVLCVPAMWVMARIGAWLRKHLAVSPSQDKENLTLVISTSLTLLGLIIGFTFSMAISRYDQRRLFEENEANSIGTEYVRADLLPAAGAATVKPLLIQYLDQRIVFYNSDYGKGLMFTDKTTSDLQASLWQSILAQASAQPSPVTALVVSGMNDVLNSQGYAQFAWWNRIPDSAWELLLLLGLFTNLLVGYGAQRSKFADHLLLVLPFVFSASFFLIAEIDSPRGGIIRIPPKDLISLSHSLHTPAR